MDASRAARQAGCHPVPLAVSQELAQDVTRRARTCRRVSQHAAARSPAAERPGTESVTERADRVRPLRSSAESRFSRSAGSSARYRPLSLLADCHGKGPTVRVRQRALRGCLLWRGTADLPDAAYATRVVVKVLDGVYGPHGAAAARASRPRARSRKAGAARRGARGRRRRRHYAARVKSAARSDRRAAAPPRRRAGSPPPRPSDHGGWLRGARGATRTTGAPGDGRRSRPGDGGDRAPVSADRSVVSAAAAAPSASGR